MFKKNFKNHFEYQIVANLKVLNRNTHFYDVGYLLATFVVQTIYRIFCS